MKSFIATTALATAAMAVKLESMDTIEAWETPEEIKNCTHRTTGRCAKKEEKKEDKPATATGGSAAPATAAPQKVCFKKLNSDEAKQIFEKIAHGKHEMSNMTMYAGYKKMKAHFAEKNISQKILKTVSSKIVEKCFNTNMKDFEKTTNMCKNEHSQWAGPLEQGVRDANAMQGCKSDDWNGTSMYAVMMDALARGEAGDPNQRPATAAGTGNHTHPQGTAAANGPATGTNGPAATGSANTKKWPQTCFAEPSGKQANEIFAKFAHGKEEMSIKQFYADAKKFEETLKGENINPMLFNDAAHGIMKQCFGAKDMVGLMQMIKDDSAKCKNEHGKFVAPLQVGIKNANNGQGCPAGKDDRDVLDLVNKALM